MQVWETSGGAPIASIPTTAMFYVPHAFSRDGRLFAFAEPEALLVWDLAAGREIWRHAEPARNVTALAFSPDGRALAAGADDTTILLWAMPAPTRKPIPAAERDAVWAALGSPDLPAAHSAQWRMMDDPETALAVIRGHCLPVPADPEVVRAQVRDLGSADFKKREAAEKRLKELGAGAAKELRASHAAETQPETRKRLAALLAALDGDGSREARVVAILERIGTPAARKLLDEVATSGTPRLVSEAKLALQRLGD